MMRPSRDPKPSSIVSDIPINDLGQVKWQPQSQQLNALNPQRNQQPSQQIHASQYSHQRPQNQGIHHQQQQHRQLLLEETAARNRSIWIASRTNPQFQPINFPLRPPVNRSHEPKLYIRRLKRFMHDQRYRPQDNNIKHWRMFVEEYFALNAKMKLCLSVYGRDPCTAGLIPQDAWHCELCNHDHGSGFEASFEVFPRLFQVKFERVQEEYFLDNMFPIFTNRNGQIELFFPNADQESVIGQSRVVRKGQLRIVFNLDMKICSWEFCTRFHEEFIPRRLITPQLVRSLSSSSELAQSMEVFQVNELGYPSRYFGILEIAHVLNGIRMDQIRQTQDQAHQQQQINHPTVVSESTINIPMQQLVPSDRELEPLEMNNDLTPFVDDNFDELPSL